jgi:hypothetical protein
MKITEKELRKLVQEAVKSKLATLNEGRAFSAKRSIAHNAGSAAMAFETDIVKELDLLSPDEMPEKHQQVYLQIMDDMKAEITAAAAKAVDRLIPCMQLPKPQGDNNQGPQS